DAGQTISLQLDPHGRALRALGICPARWAQEAHHVLDVVSVLVGDHVRLGKWAALGAEARAQLVEKAEIEVDLLVVWAVKRAAGWCGGVASARRGAQAAAEQLEDHVQHHQEQPPATSADHDGHIEAAARTDTGEAAAG